PWTGNRTAAFPRSGRRISGRSFRLRHRSGTTCRLLRPVQFRRLAGEDVIMSFPPVHRQLLRMEEARRQTRHQLDLIERQITRRMTALMLQLGRKQSGYRRGKPPDPTAFLERYRTNLAAITAEYQPEIDALSRKLARQDAAIAVL